MPTEEATQVKCPECGARLAVPVGAEVTRCTYCGTESRVQRRTAFLQRRMPLVAGAPLDPLRIAHQVRTATRAVAVVTGALVGAGLVAALVVHEVLDTAVSSIQSSPLLASAYWESSEPTVVDVDGDGVLDFVGFDRDVRADTMLLAAYSGQTGHRLWETANLGSTSHFGGANVLASGDTVIAWDQLAHLSAFDRKTGAARWHVTAPEVVKGGCSADGHALLRTADDKVWSVGLADGALVPSTAACTPPAPFGDVTGADAPPEHPYAMPGDRPVIPGMTTDVILVRGTGPRIIRGERTPGTGVPMLAAVDAHGADLWKTDIPGHDALAAASAGGEMKLAISDYEVAVEYQRSASEPPELTAFDRVTGARRFEIIAHKNSASVPESVVIVQGSVALSMWGSLQVYDVKTGASRFDIGD